MPQHLFEDLCHVEGFCCPFAYLRAVKAIRTGVLAKHLGIDPRSLRRWREKFKAEELHCLNEGLCQKNRAKIHPLVKE